MTLHCISFNGSLPINYTFFAKGIAISPVISTYVREPAEFNLTKNTGEVEEYSCEAKNRLPNHAKYSETFHMPSRGKGYLSSFNRVWICFQKLLPPDHFPLWPSASKCLSFGGVLTNSDGVAFCKKQTTKTTPGKPRGWGRKGPSCSTACLDPASCLDLPLPGF